ncbi:hypothetical protein NKG05_10285 [Oerskovia sp. M15]
MPGAGPVVHRRDRQPGRAAWGTLAPTVKLQIAGTSAVVDRSYGNGGLGGYGDIPSNEAQDVPQTPNPRPVPFP